MNKAIGAILVFGTICGAIFLGGKPGYFIDIPSMVFVLGIVFGSLILKFGIKSLTKSWSHRHFCEVGQASAMIAGVLGPVIGIIHILHNFSDPKRMGPAVAVSLITFLYAIIMNLLFILLKEKGKEDEPFQNKNVTMMSFVGLFLCLSMVPVLMTALS